MYGRLAVATITTANTWQNIYQINANCLRADVDISVLNPNATDATCKVALTSTTTPAANEYVENGAVVPANGGRLVLSDNRMSAGEYIFIQTSLSGCVIRVAGDELTSIPA